MSNPWPRRWASAAVLVLLLVGLSSLVVTTGDLDARGKPGGGKTRDQTGTLTVAPASVASGDTYVVSGQGFRPDQPVFVAFHEPFCCASKQVWADADGRWTITRAAGGPATYTVNAYQYKGKKLVLVATVSFPVS